MRDLLFKNLTSSDRKRRVISSSEVSESEGVRSVIRRHFICMVREVKREIAEKPASCLYVIKEHNTKEHREKFFCKIKGSIYAIKSGRIFLITFMHSLRIDLLSAEQSLA